MKRVRLARLPVDDPGPPPPLLELPPPPPGGVNGAIGNGVEVAKKLNGLWSLLILPGLKPANPAAAGLGRADPLVVGRGGNIPPPAPR